MVNFGQSSYGVMEGDGSVTIVILLSQPSLKILRLPINLMDVSTTGMYFICIAVWIINI